MMRRLILLFIIATLAAGTSYGAFNATTNWDVRTTGSDTNGGGFQLSATGTDRSQSDAAYQAYTDIVIGATTTQGTSVLFPFGATTPGNIVNITGGAGCTVQRVQAVSQAAGVVTFDKSLGAAASTCTGNLGGSLLTPNLAVSLAIASNIIHIKAGTYTLTSSAASTNGINTTIIGYQTTHQDFGTRPLITTATDSTTLIQVFGNPGLLHTIANINFSNTAAVRSNGVSANRAGDTSGLFYRCAFDGFVNAVGRTGGGFFGPFLELSEVEIKNGTGNGFYSRASIYVFDSYIHNNGGHGGYMDLASSSTQNVVKLFRSIFSGNTGDGFAQGNGDVYRIIYAIHDSTFSGNGGDGFQSGAGGGGLTAPFIIDLQNNIFYGNGGYGVNNPVAPTLGGLNRTNAYGNNVPTAVLNMPAGIGDVALGADPFTNSAGGDYSLNSTATGGALLRATGFPGVFPGSTTTGYLDIGAVQSAAGPAATAHGSAFVQ